MGRVTGCNVLHVLMRVRLIHDPRKQVRRQFNSRAGQYFFGNRGGIHGALSRSSRSEAMAFREVIVAPDLGAFFAKNFSSAVLGPR